jgi:phosphoribosyl 1,2-cyclic phosphate phosphodiesterase
MKFIIIGSGGCVALPRPLCQCTVCVQARERGRPYARCSSSLYLEEAALLVDTPEDINSALNNADIRSINNILYSHWDPDHTLGMRIIEQLRLEWLDYYDNIKPKNKINIYAAKDVMRDVNGIRNLHGSFMDYYEHMGLIERKMVNEIFENDIKITLVPVQKDKAVTVFVFESKGKKLIYAPCDCKPFPEDEIIYNADVLIIGNTFIGNTLKNNTVIHKEHPLRNELHSMEDVLNIKSRLNIKKVIITHIEEDWGKSYDDYKKLEKEYEDTCLAYDGMEIVL